MGEERRPDKERTAAAPAEAELQAPRGEYEVPAEGLEVHSDLIKTARLVRLLVGADISSKFTGPFVQVVAVDQVL